MKEIEIIYSDPRFFLCHPCAGAVVSGENKNEEDVGAFLDCFPRRYARGRNDDRGKAKAREYIKDVIARSVSSEAIQSFSDSCELFYF